MSHFKVLGVILNKPRVLTTNSSWRAARGSGWKYGIRSPPRGALSENFFLNVKGGVGEDASQYSSGIVDGPSL